MTNLSAYAPFFAAFWFFVSAGYLLYHLQRAPGNTRQMYPISAYLVGIGMFFVFTGWSTFATSSCALVDCTQFAGGLSVMLAASFIARFPIRDRWPDHEKAIVAVLAVISVVSTAVTAVYAPALQVPMAHVYAFVVAGLFSVGYIIYAAYVDDSPGGMGVGLSMSSCCVIAHGLAAVPLVFAVSLPLVGVSLQLPMVFAILSPISLLAVIVFFARLETNPEADVSTGVDASP